MLAADVRRHKSNVHQTKIQAAAEQATEFVLLLFFFPVFFVHVLLSAITYIINNKAGKCH